MTTSVATIIKDTKRTNHKTQKLQTEITVVMRKVTNDPSVLKVRFLSTGLWQNCQHDDNVKLASATVTKVNTESKNVLSQIKKDNSKLIIA